MEKEDNNDSNAGLYASCLITGVVAHMVGYAVELTANYSLRTLLPNNNYNNIVYTVVGKLFHEGVENIISSGGIINLMNLNNLRDSLVRAVEPIYEEPVKFISAATFSYLAEFLLSNYMHHGHHHHGHQHAHHHGHKPLEIGAAALASVAGASFGIFIYDYFTEE